MDTRPLIFRNWMTDPLAMQLRCEMIVRGIFLLSEKVVDGLSAGMYVVSIHHDDRVTTVMFGEKHKSLAEEAFRGARDYHSRVLALVSDGVLVTTLQKA